MVASLMLCLAMACDRPQKLSAKPSITFILALPSSKVDLSAISLGMDPDGSLFDDAGHIVYESGRNTFRSVRKLFYANQDGSPKKLDLYLRDEKNTSFASIAEFMQRIRDVADNHTNVIVYVRLHAANS